MTNMEQKIIEIPIDKIKPNPNQPRKRIDEVKLQELADSIKASGLVNPINVIKKNNYWELVSGERRWRAHKIAKIKTIKAIEKEYKKDSSRKIDSLIENLHREDLNEYEKAKTLQEVKDDDNMSIKELAKYSGLSETTVRNLTALLDPAMEHLAEAVKKGEIIEHHARVVKTIKDKDTEKKVLNIIKEKELSVTKTEALVRTLKNVTKEVKEAVLDDEITIEQADRISKIGTEEGRKKAIHEHKTIKMVDKGVERNIVNQMSAKEKREFEKKLVQARQMTMSLRNSVTDSYSAIEKTLKIIKAIIPYVTYMDDKEKHKFNIELGRLMEILERGSQLTEQIKEKIEDE
jgi:ParB family chromosome partitioning protein